MNINASNNIDTIFIFVSVLKTTFFRVAANFKKNCYYMWILMLEIYFGVST